MPPNRSVALSSIAAGIIAAGGAIALFWKAQSRGDGFFGCLALAAGIYLIIIGFRRYRSGG
jgi:hypothetical protein